MRPSILIPLGLVAALGLGACSDVPVAPDVGVTPEANAGRMDRNPTAAPKKGADPIAQIAIDGGFSELVGALAYVDGGLGTGLVDLFLNGKDQYTVFAPTDGAFRELYGLLSVVLGSTVDEITDVPAGVVLDVLLYHVADGRRAANSVVPKKGERTVETLLGESFSVRSDLTIEDGLSGTGLRGDASIRTPNISASNGIIHVIDTVIVPPSVVAALTS